MMGLPNNRRRYFTSPTHALALAAVASLLTGCIAFPTPGRIQREVQAEGPNVDIRKLTGGTADSDRPIRPGVLREAVRAQLGAPDNVSQNGQDEASTYRSYNWWVFCIIPLVHFWGDMSPTEYKYILRIKFDNQERVQSLTLDRSPG